MKGPILFSALAAVVLGSPEHILSKRVAPVVDLGYAKYEGSYNASTGVTRFLGIRYAAAPTGNLRWEKPQKPAYIHGIQKADTFGNICYSSAVGAASTTPFRAGNLMQQNGVAARASVPSEDCLFLNIWTPTTASARSPIPVIFWIHGGGYVFGDATGYDGADLLATSENGVIVVTIQYRLGVFGFLSGSEVKKNGALNAGLFDQQFALQWVQDHIHKFGGDPSRVTIWGVSAGAGSVLQHIIANGGNTKPQLFRNAISSSSFLPSQYNYNDRISETLYTETVDQAGCYQASDTLYCLRQADTTILQAANVNISASGFFGTFVFVPVVDGTLIQQRPIEALKQRKVNGRTLLAVSNSDEGSLFVDPDTPANVDVANYVKQLFPHFSDAQAVAAAAQYQDLGAKQLQPSKIMGDSIFLCPTLYLLNAFNGKGYKGTFAVPPALHGQDMFYYWTSLVIPGFPVPDFSNAPFTKAFAQSFIDFAITDNPNDKLSDTLTPAWPQWAGETEMLFNRTEAREPDIRAITTSSSLLSRCRFWESLGAAAGQ